MKQISRALSGNLFKLQIMGLVIGYIIFVLWSIWWIYITVVNAYAFFKQADDLGLFGIWIGGFATLFGVALFGGIVWW